MKVYFYNNGFLPRDSFALMGASEKSEGAIGFFGTGLKYAIACILRWNGSIEIKVRFIGGQIEGLVGGGFERSMGEAVDVVRAMMKDRGLG